MMTGKRRKTGGRQPGTKNHERLDAVAIPPACKKCGGQLVVRSGVFRTFVGQFKVGETTYTKVELKRCICKDCKQHHIVRYHSFRNDLSIAKE